MGIMTGVHDAKRLAELTALPLDRKIQISQTRIIEWYTHYKGNVCVAFSGGKDSTVLLHLVRTMFPDVRAVFSNTGLEYPEIRQFATSFHDVDVVSPSMRFDQVVSTYGYPIIGKEVAEAIHYARKICRSQSVNVERERERARDTASGRNFLVSGRKQTYRKRTELLANAHSDRKRKIEENNPTRKSRRSRGREVDVQQREVASIGLYTVPHLALLLFRDEEEAEPSVLQQEQTVPIHRDPCGGEQNKETSMDSPRMQRF